eukprot:9443391-Alexandrium_andersonii.AAC.1
MATQMPSVTGSPNKFSGDDAMGSQPTLSKHSATDNLEGGRRRKPRKVWDYDQELDKAQRGLGKTLTKFGSD